MSEFTFCEPGSGTARPPGFSHSNTTPQTPAARTPPPPVRDVWGLPARIWRLLFLFSDTGGGHRSAAYAVAETLRTFHGEKAQIELVDALAERARDVSVLREQLERALRDRTRAERAFEAVSGSPGSVLIAAAEEAGW